MYHPCKHVATVIDYIKLEIYNSFLLSLEKKETYILSENSNALPRWRSFTAAAFCIYLSRS